MSRPACLRAFKTSNPSIFGICRSRSMRSGCSVRARCRASSPSVAQSAVYPLGTRSESLMNSILLASSSTISIFCLSMFRALPSLYYEFHLVFYQS